MHVCLRPAVFALVWTGLCLGVTLHPTSAGAQGAIPSNVDSLSARTVAFDFRYAPTLSSSLDSRDRWIARDKGRHVVFSGLWTLSTQYVLVQKAGWSEGDALPAAAASGFAVGLAKEGYDASRPAETASRKDLVANAIGVGLAVGVILL